MLATPPAEDWLPVTSTALRQRLMSKQLQDGALEMYRPSPNVIYTRARGHLAQALAAEWAQCTSSIWGSTKKLTVFNDWQLMTNYDSTARAALTEWVIAHRNQFEAAWFASQSRLVTMGIAVAGVATAMLGVPMHAPAERSTFLKRLEETIGR